MAWGADYANDRPDLRALNARLCRALLRYVGAAGAATTKNCTAEEIALAALLGWFVALVYEDDGGVYGGGPAQGYARGYADAVLGNRQADALGYPDWAVLFAAVDTDGLDWGTVAAYFRGFRDGSKRPVGGYGQPQLMEWLLDQGLVVAVLWCTWAWSGGYRSPRAALEQRVGKTYAGDVDGDFDENDIKADPAVPWWYPGQPVQEEDDIVIKDQETKEYFDRQFDRIAGGEMVGTKAAVDATNAKGNQTLGAVLVGIQSLEQKIAQLAPTAAAQLVAHGHELADLSIAGVQPGEAVPTPAQAAELAADQATSKAS